MSDIVYKFRMKMVPVADLLERLNKDGQRGWRVASVLDQTDDGFLVLQEKSEEVFEEEAESGE